MKKWKKLLARAQELGADYADLRYIEKKGERINCKNGKIDVLNFRGERGVGLRVRLNGGWGFAATSWEQAEPELALAEEAVEIARASSSLIREKRSLSPVKLVQDSHKVVIEEDPFCVPLKERIELLKKTVGILKQDPRIIIAGVGMDLRWERKLFLSTEGSEIEQEFYITGAGLQAMSSDGKDRQVRTYPTTFGGDYAQAGFEFIRRMDFLNEAERVRKEALELLQAHQCPSGEMTLILGGSQLALQIHESCGHPIELDRVLGTEAGFAGTSFLTPDKLGELQYGSPYVNITADATIPGALGSFAYDDEGVPAQRVPIVKEGLFTNYLTSRETAPIIGQESNGTMRGMGWQHLPIVRMTNINLEPGESSLKELIAGTEKGILMDNIKSWSIDDKRMNFQFGTEVGWLIEDGKITGMVKNPIYTGSTVAFWNSCDGVAGKDEWKIWGVPNCGKGEPTQPATVGHGSSYARFRNVKVGVGKW